jgi:FkbM family methyltransferase
MLIEIGTSDFDTQAGLQNGLFIEPIRYYYDRLPNCLKENVAISNYTGEADFFYVTEEQINMYNQVSEKKIPKWLKGCVSIHQPHQKLLQYFDISDLKKERVKVVKIKSLIDKYDISEIDFLKIDAEGHDCIILNNFLDEVSIYPKKIQFESNSLSDPSDIEKLINRLSMIGYSIEKLSKDTIAKWNNLR